MALGAGRSLSDGEEQGAPPAFLSNVTPKCPGAVGAEPTGWGGRAQGLICRLRTEPESCQESGFALGRTCRPSLWPEGLHIVLAPYVFCARACACTHTHTLLCFLLGEGGYR